MTLYEVTARRRFRGHSPGTRFEADLDQRIVDRALGRGDIRVIDEGPTKLRPGSYQLPPGWPVKPNRTREVQ